MAAKLEMMRKNYGNHGRLITNLRQLPQPENRKEKDSRE
jgi:hypothetical protein